MGNTPSDLHNITSGSADTNELVNLTPATDAIQDTTSAKVGDTIRNSEVDRLGEAILYQGMNLRVGLYTAQPGSVEAKTAYDLGGKAFRLVLAGREPLLIKKYGLYSTEVDMLTPAYLPVDTDIPFLAHPLEVDSHSAGYDYTIVDISSQQQTYWDAKHMQLVVGYPCRAHAGVSGEIHSGVLTTIIQTTEEAGVPNRKIATRTLELLEEDVYACRITSQPEGDTVYTIGDHIFTQRLLVNSHNPDKQRLVLYNAKGEPVILGGHPVHSLSFVQKQSEDATTYDAFASVYDAKSLTQYLKEGAKTTVGEHITYGQLIVMSEGDEHTTYGPLIVTPVTIDAEGEISELV